MTVDVKRSTASFAFIIVSFIFVSHRAINTDQSGLFSFHLASGSSRSGPML